MTSRLEVIGSRFDGFSRNGDGWKARCPFHDDEKPSLSLNEGDDGQVLAFCHAGCSTKDLLEVVGLTLRDLRRDHPMIVAEYDYRDADGALLYQVVRFDPKGFRQRRPDGNGGWIWNLQGVQRVPYRLPELLAADRKSMVFDVEGEKDAERLVAEGLIATTNAGGAGKWEPGFGKYLKGRKVVIIPDNDEPGRKHADTIAQSLLGVAKSIQILELPDLPEKGDVTDWFNAGGTKAKLLDLVKNTPTVQTEQRVNGTDKKVEPNSPTGQQDADPLGVGPLGVPVDPFPIEVYPEALRHLIQTASEAFPCPPDFLGVMMLGALSACIGRKRSIAVTPSWIEYPLAWLAVVARSGDRKTPAYEKATEPLRDIQMQLWAEYRQAKRDFAALKPADQAQAERPVLQQILTTDTTIEALKVVLQNNPNGIIFTGDELSAWARGIGQYKGGKGDDRQHWLSIWSGTQIVCNRKGDAEPTVIGHPFVSVLGGIQPDALGDLIDDSREDGFSARILFSYPDPIANKEWSEASVSGVPAYRSICQKLWRLKPSRDPITFSPAAKEVWIEWVNAHRREEPADTLRPMWSKLEGYCLRLTLILFLTRQVAGETQATEIDDPSITGAVKLVSYFKSHARRVYRSATQSKDEGRIASALRWIKRRLSTGDRITARLAHMHGLTKSSAEARELFDDLAELGHGTVTEESRGSVVFHLTEVVRS